VSNTLLYGLLRAFIFAFLLTLSFSFTLPLTLTLTFALGCELANLRLLIN